MSDVEREMMIDSEDFEQVDVEMIVKQILNQIIDDAVLQSETNQCEIEKIENFTVDENDNTIKPASFEGTESTTISQSSAKGTESNSFNKETEPEVQASVIRGLIGKEVLKSAV